MSTAISSPDTVARNRAAFIAAVRAGLESIQRAAAQPHAAVWQKGASQGLPQPSQPVPCPFPARTAQALAGRSRPSER